jgi:predicted outer membrane repeat protein
VLLLPYLAVAALAHTACATTIIVDWAGSGDHETIQAGVDAASYGDTVLVMSGTYTGPGNTDIVIGDVGITVIAYEGDRGVTIDCGGSGRGLYLEDIFGTALLFRGLTITNGSADEGGAVYCYHANAAFEDCVFSNSTATVAGGGVRCDYYCDVSFTECSFVGNSSGEDGGGLCITRGTSGSFTDCLFSGNSSVDQGGGLYLTSDMAFSGCDFEGNSAQEGGGAFLYYSNASFTSCSFAGNSVSHFGAGGQCEYGTPVFTGCTFESNVAGEGGVNSTAGGLHLHVAPAELKSCTFVGNSAKSAGAMKCESSHAFVDSCVFRDNIASFGSGGAVRLLRSSPVIRFTAFSGNSANQDGGALYCSTESDASIVNCTFARNSALDEGGGIHAAFDASVSLDRCIVALNESGGAASCYDGGTITFTCSDIFANEGGDWIGCIADQLGANGNIDLDPLFCDVFGDDVTLCSNSPCLADTIGCIDLVGAGDQGCEDCQSPARRDSWGAIKAMFR